jgi:lantibiotic modifying enzyme
MTTTAEAPARVRVPALARGEGVAAEAREAADGIARFALAHMDPSRRDRLWPTDYTVYETNPLSLAVGACGTALFLQDALGALPDEARRWLLEQPRSAGRIPPGLWTGLAGIAVALQRLGEAEAAWACMREAAGSPLLYAEAGLHQGAAGWGAANLRMHEATGRGWHLERAVETGEALLRASRTAPEGRFWPNPSGRVPLGYGYGAAGVGAFLLALSRAVDEPRFRAAAVEAMEHDLAHAVVVEGVSWWGSAVGDHIVLPYWMQGAAGMGELLLRFHRALGDERWLELARQAAEPVRGLFSVTPAQFDGMSGMGEFLLDLHAATGDEEYRHRACEMARSVLCYRIDGDEGVAFPGRHLGRITLDYAQGSAGVGAFLLRLAEGGTSLHHVLLP